jgi:hypothetical protein
VGWACVTHLSFCFEETFHTCRCFLPSFGSSRQFQRRRLFRNRPMWWPCLLTDRDEMSNLHRGHSIDDSYQVSVHLVKRFQKKELPVVAMFGNVSKQNVHSLERTFHRCFLPSFSSFGWGFSEENIKMWKVNEWQTTDTKWWQKLISQGLLKRILKCEYLLVMYRTRGSVGWACVTHLSLCFEET